MENILHQFINHLIEIGLTNPTTITDFLSIYNKHSDHYTPSTQYPITQEDHPTEIYFRDIVTKSIVSYLDTMSQNNKQDLAMNIYSRFIKNLLQERASGAKRLLMLYGMIQTKKAQLTQRNKFKQWKRLLNNASYSTFLNLSIMTDKSNRYNKNSGLSIESSRYLKEQEELRHCTFQPMINHSYSEKNSGVYGNTNHNNSKDISLISVHDRLYTDHKRICSRREFRQLERDKQIALTSTFQPTLVSTTSSRDVSCNFKERLKSFENKRNNNKERIIEEIEKDYSSKCSFSPNINITQKRRNVSRSPSANVTRNSINNNSVGRIPAYERLYQHGDVMKKNNIRLQNEIQKDIKLKASPSFNSIKNGQAGIQAQYQGQGQNQVDYRKIEALYNDYKKIKNKTDKKREEIDKEQGLTFKPELNVNEKFNNKVTQNMNFYERENKFVEEKKKFVEVFNLIVDEQSKGKRWGNGNYTSKEKDEIAQGVIERLYVKELEKMNIRKEDRNPTKDMIENNNNNNDSNTVNRIIPSEIIEDSKYENSNSEMYTNSDRFRVNQMPIAYENRRNKMY